jgi:hypothetical protein
MLGLAAPDAAGEPVGRVVGDRDRLIVVCVGITAMTGPKISSWAIVIPLSTAANTVGSTK